ncbi:hypothetical protein TorRG33x02_300530 [Trema orientale]|uniref:Uncharacterized protein n=1 Tax=Trema orientale TaxID=63057 RepID=A0A2P5C200_TREOI|nr:hypothetical protein TorRG33x02_300530 [Trema orientale]
MAHNLRGSEWSQAIVQIKERFSLVSEVSLGIEAILSVGRLTFGSVSSPSGLATWPRVTGLPLGSCDVTSGHKASPQGLRRALWSHNWVS